MNFINSHQALSNVELAREKVQHYRSYLLASFLHHHVLRNLHFGHPGEQEHLSTTQYQPPPIPSKQIIKI